MREADDDISASTSSNLLNFLSDKPRLARTVQRWVIDTDIPHVEDNHGKHKIPMVYTNAKGGDGSASDVDGAWHFRSLFVVEATLFNITVIFFLLFFWVINRQTHMRKTKGNTIKRKSDQSETTDDDSSVDEHSDEEDDLDEDRELVNISTSTSRRRTLMEKLVSYGIEQDEDDFDPMSKVGTSSDDEENDQPWSKPLNDLLRTARTLWYLNMDALIICAKAAEYSLYQQRQTIFEADNYDGTFYAVLSGSVELVFDQFEMPEELLPRGCKSTQNEEYFRVTVGPDKPLTSFMALFWGMVEINLKKDKKEMKCPFRMSAKALSDDTQLICIRPESFAEILKEFPVDVFRLTGTILNRLQRITIQTLVKTLGLRKELLPLPRSIPSYQNDLVLSAPWKRFLTTINKNGFTEEIDVMREMTHLFRIRMGITSEIDADSLSLLRDSSELIVFEGAQTLIEAGTKLDACYLLLQGDMESGIYIQDGPREMVFHRHQTICPGALLGEHECFTGEVSIAAVRHLPTKECVNCYLLKVPRSVYNTLIVRYPYAMSRAIDSLLHQISPAVFLLQATAAFVDVKAANNVIRKGSKCDSLYVVLNGRLRARKKKDDARIINQKAPEEYGRGKVVGEIGILTGAVWPADVYAIRHSEIARIPVQVILAIVQSYPKAGLNFARSIALQMSPSDSHLPRPERAKISRIPSSSNYGERTLPSYGLKLATIAVVPIDATGIDLDKLCSTLASGFGSIAPTKLLSKHGFLSELGQHEKPYRHHNSAMHELRMVRMLADIEESNRIVVYQADRKYTWWTRLCIQQADCILLVANSNRAPPEGTRVEQSLAWAFDSMDVRIDLVVVGQPSPDVQSHDIDELDDEDFDLEDDEEMTVGDQLNNWSEERKWILGHHLVRTPFGRYKQDLHRLCRRVTGRAVGLVLGSGGARGLAHLGVIRALKEAGLTIDLVGGTSQGAFVGSLYARQPDDVDAVFTESRKMAKELASVKSKLLDLTLPMTSMFSGYMFSRGIRKRLGNLRIQDLVLNFFCVSVDLTKQKEVIHTKGLLWKYVRASMSLTGYLPPVAENEQLLVDGAYMNSVPTDVMRYQMGARIVIACDPTGETQREHYMWGSHLSGWWVLWNSLNPFVKTVKVPSMGDCSDMLLWASAEKQLRHTKRLADLYLEPPVGHYGTLEYDKLDEIVEKSYKHVKPLIDEFVRKNPWLVHDSKKARSDTSNDTEMVTFEKRISSS